MLISTIFGTLKDGLGHIFKKAKKVRKSQTKVGNYLKTFRIFIFPMLKSKVLHAVAYFWMGHSFLLSSYI